MYISASLRLILALHSQCNVVVLTHTLWKIFNVCFCHWRRPKVDGSNIYYVTGERNGESEISKFIFGCAMLMPSLPAALLKRILSGWHSAVPLTHLIQFPERPQRRRFLKRKGAIFSNLQHFYCSWSCNFPCMWGFYGVFVDRVFIA